MITKMTHVSVQVLDQDRALDFYTNKLGFKLLKDLPMGNGDRWITVAPHDQPGFEIILAPVSTSAHSEETAKMLRELVAKELLAPGFLPATTSLLPMKN